MANDGEGNYASRSPIGHEAIPQKKEVGKFLSIAIMIVLSFVGVFAVIYILSFLQLRYRSQVNDHDLLEIASLVLNAAAITVGSVFIITLALTVYNIYQIQQQRKEVEQRIARDESNLTLMELRIKLAEEKIGKFQDPDSIIRTVEALIKEAARDISSDFDRKYVAADALSERIKKDVELGFVERIYTSALGSALVAEALRDTASSHPVRSKS